MNPNEAPQRAHHHSRLGRAPSYDAPATPPASRFIPEWNRCGRHNCNTHHYTDLHPAHGPLVLGLDQPVSLHRRHCHGCNRRYNTVSLHFLPCHHALCRDCLNQTAAMICTTLQRDKAQIDNTLANGFLRGQMGAQTNDAQLAALMAEEEADLFADACARAGFTCCGQPMRLWRFLYCLDAEVATRFWCAQEYMVTRLDKQNHCGWADCGAFVPNKCGFVGLTGYAPEILHCPICRGNGELIYRAEVSPNSETGRCNVWKSTRQPFPRCCMAAQV